MLIVGLMTGTSLDGIDAALVDIRGEDVESLQWRLIHSRTHPYDDARRSTIHAAILEGSSATICDLHAQMGEWLAEAVHGLCDAARVDVDSVDLVGSHGQTIWHVPPSGGLRGSTLQIGCPATIAERTGADVISDFRSRDVAAGGQGAPLVPWVDQVLFADPHRVRALQNIGGIGNVTRVPPKGSPEPLLAFDTGPGNALINAAVSFATGGRFEFDRDGRLAAQGNVDEALLGELLAHPFFSLEPPRSTGREAFGGPMVQRLIEATRPEGDQEWLDLIATLTELTARSIADAYERWVVPRGVDEVIVTGGGAFNPTLMARIRAHLEPVPVLDCRTLKIGPSEKEALAFAVLAWAHVRRIPSNAPSATGASGPRILGSFTPGCREKVPEV